MTEQECKDFFLQYLPDVKNIIFNKVTTILIFKNGEKSVVQWDLIANDFDREKAVLYAYAKYKIKECKQFKKLKELLNICTQFQNLKMKNSQFSSGGIGTHKNDQPAPINVYLADKEEHVLTQNQLKDYLKKH